jgi:hypothetical protein
MSDSWRIEVATRRGDHTVLTTTAITGVSFERYIGKVGSFAATIAAPNARAATRLQPLIRDDVALTLNAYISRGDEIWCGGMLGDPNAVINGRAGDTIALEGVTFEGYPDRRTAYDDVAWSNVEQLQIAQDIWSLALADEGNLDIDLPAYSPSGVARDLTVARTDRRTLGSMLSEISGRENGFEWLINCYRDAGVRKRALVLGSPLIDGGDGPTFTYPGNMLQFGRKPSTAKTATRFWAVGGAPTTVTGEPGAPIYTEQLRTEELLANGAVLIDSPFSYSDIVLQDTLDDRAAEARRRYGAPLPVLSATVPVDTVSPSILGTSPRLRVNHPFFPSNNNQPGYDARSRVIGMKVKPNERGESGEVELIFEEP